MSAQQQPAQQWNTGTQTHLQHSRAWITVPLYPQERLCIPQQPTRVHNMQPTTGASYQCGATRGNVNRQCGGRCGNQGFKLPQTTIYYHPPTAIQGQQFRGNTVRGRLSGQKFRSKSPPNPRKFDHNDCFFWFCRFDVDHPGNGCPDQNKAISQDEQGTISANIWTWDDGAPWANKKHKFRMDTHCTGIISSRLYANEGKSDVIKYNMH